MELKVTIQTFSAGLQYAVDIVVAAAILNVR